MEWKEYNICQLCDTISETYKGKSNSVVLINTSDVLEGKVLNHKRVPNKGLKGQFKKTFKKNDILYSEIRPANKRFAYINFSPNDYIASTKLMVLRSKPIVSSYFLFQILKSEIVLKNLQMLAESRSGTFPQITYSELSNVRVKVPPLPVQDKIVGILSALDSKIENNNKINANLEAQAEALFKSWFVDFTPFKDQPFVDSELGPIPQGWKVGKADDFYKINIGKTPPRKEKEWFSKNESDNKWISISDMGNCGLFISNSAEKLTNAAIKKFNISLVPVNTILLSFKLTIGRVAISDCDLTTNEAIARFILPDECYLEFSFLMLKLYNYSTLGSTSSIATAVNSKIIKSMKMVMPSLKVLEDFHTITNPLFEKIRFTQKENQRLAALRDTLLPKLMSGEIKL